MRILCKLPSRQRPTHLFNTLERWTSLLSGQHQVQILCTFDSDDGSMNNLDVLQRLGDFKSVWRDTVRLTWNYGNSKSKIQAVNADLELAEPWDMFILASDDMICKVDSYDDVMARDMLKHYPNFGGCLRYGDGRRNDLYTLSVFGSGWYNVVRQVYHPDFFSLFSDDHQQWLAESMGRMTFIPDKVPIVHEWQSLTGYDALHAVNSPDAVYRRDEKTFHRLKAAGIPKEMLERLAQTPK